MSTILIAGAGGYIGTEMTAYFLEKGYKVKALDRFFFGDTLNHLLPNENLEIIQGDIRNFKPEDLKNVDYSIDMASISNDPSSELLPEITESINYKGAVHLAKTAKEAGVKKHLFSSSCSVYGSGQKILTETSATAPISTYAKCKLLAEKEILELGDENFCVSSLRNATVFGISHRMRFDLIINIMTLHAWKNNRIFIMGGGKQWRPLVHLQDLIKAFDLTLEAPAENTNKEIFNVGSDENNYQVFQVAYKFRDFFPNIQIDEIPEDPDPRSYRVSFKKINDTLEFKAAKNIDEGILEVKTALENGTIQDSITARTVEYYKFLINADKTLNRVKINNTLF